MRQRCGDVTRVVHCTGVAPGDGRRSTPPRCPCVRAARGRVSVPIHLPAGSGKKPMPCAHAHSLRGARRAMWRTVGFRWYEGTKQKRSGAERQAARLPALLVLRALISVPSVRCWSTRHHHHHSGPRNLCELEEISWRPQTSRHR